MLSKSRSWQVLLLVQCLDCLSHDLQLPFMEDHRERHSATTGHINYSIVTNYLTDMVQQRRTQDPLEDTHRMAITT